MWNTNVNVNIVFSIFNFSTKNKKKTKIKIQCKSGSVGLNCKVIVGGALYLRRSTASGHTMNDVGSIQTEKDIFVVFPKWVKKTNFRCFSKVWIKH